MYCYRQWTRGIDKGTTEEQFGLLLHWDGFDAIITCFYFSMDEHPRRVYCYCFLDCSHHGTRTSTNCAAIQLKLKDGAILNCVIFVIFGSVKVLK
jgi:hypothetical protein